MAVVGFDRRHRPRSGIRTMAIFKPGVGGYPRGLTNSHGVQYAPRIGVAYSLNSKTVLRMGAAGLSTSECREDWFMTKYPANPPVLRQLQITYAPFFVDCGFG